MNKLIKSEFYRLWNSGNMKIIFFFLFFVMAFWPIAHSIHQFGEDLNTTLWNGNAVEIYTMVLTLAPITAGVLAGVSYNTKTAYYEPMSGASPSSIILSKVITSGVTTGLMFWIATSLYYIYVYFANGAGECDHPLLRFLLTGFTILYICISGVLMTTSFRSLAGAALTFVRFLFLDGLIFTLLSEANSRDPEFLLQDWINVFVTAKFNTIILMPLKTSTVLYIVVPTIIEMILWYVISYVGMKKKWYN